MKINFWTSIEYGGFMEGLMRELGLKGINAEQKFNISEISYRSAKTPIERILLRLRQYIFYPIQLVIHLLMEVIRGRTSAPMVVSTNTFFAPLLASFFNNRVIHLVYDLFPEAMIHSGKWREGQFKVKFFRWLVRISLRRSAMNVFLGERLKNYVISIHGEFPNSKIIPVGADERPFKDLPSFKTNWPIEILYCGNFGNMHDSKTFFDLCKKGIDDAFTFTFHCSGPKRKILEGFRKKYINNLENSLKIGEGLSHNEWIKKMRSSPIALVTMREGAEEVVMPSKTYSAMMAGQAILAIAPENSDLVDLIKKTDCGWWIPPGDSNSLSHLLKELNAKPGLIVEKRQNSLEAANKYFGQSNLAKEWVSLFHDLQNP